MVVSPWLTLAVPLACVVFGALLAWLAGRGESVRAREQAAQSSSLRQELAVAEDRLRESTVETASLRQNLGRLEALVEALRETNGRAESEILQLREDRESLLQQRQGNDRALAEATTNLENERRQALERVAFLNEARGQLATDFENIANKILEDKSTRFTAQNKVNLDQVLTPLKDQLTDFGRKVEAAQLSSLTQSTELRVHLTQLEKLNSTLSEEASNLARALRVSPGKAGQLGDEFLRRVLETMGLQEGVNYDRQSSLRDEAGGSFRPDYILHLPGSRHVVIDAKMSLKDYDDYCNAPDETSREASLTRHLRSVRNHIGELSVKGYQSLHGINSLDFVVMFMPIEAAFHVAFAKEDLWREAWSKNILLASPSTLLFVFRTIADMWKQQKQTQNVQEIVKRGGALYDKFVGFVSDLESVGVQIDRAKSCYVEAHSKLTSGSGNLTRQVELLRSLGVKHKGKALAKELVEVAILPGDDELLQLAAAGDEQVQTDLDWEDR